ncbi:MAG: hypothetical protein FJ011_07995 [Chloroflexi bacterium]|nr:hypothetical protein [Chloroflexota bacterium]
MAIVVELIKTYAPWAYGVSALVALWYLRVTILARRERRHSMFALERETALNRTYGAWTAAIALSVFIGLVYLLSTVVSDAVQPLVVEVQTPLPTQPTSRPAVTPTPPAPESVLITPTATATRVRPTLRPEPTLISRTPTVVVQGPACPDARAVITSPGVNATVSGMTPILGTAVHERFKYYKLEYGMGEHPAIWSYFDGGEQPVHGGRLGMLNAGALGPGVYAVRIVVVDITGNFPPPCQTVIVVR